MVWLVNLGITILCAVGYIVLALRISDLEKEIREVKAGQRRKIIYRYNRRVKGNL